MTGKSSSQLVSLLLLVFASVQPPLRADEPERTFPDYKCSFTLPDMEWEWDKQKPESALVSARKGKWFAITLSVTNLAGPGTLDERFATTFEESLLKTGSKKRGGQFLQYKGLPCYQVELLLRNGDTAAVRAFLAHDIAYTLVIFGGKDPIEKDPEFEKVLGGFEFTEPPILKKADPPPAAGPQAPPPDSDYGRALSGSEWMGRIALGCVVAILLLLGFRRVIRK